MRRLPVTPAVLSALLAAALVAGCAAPAEPAALAAEPQAAAPSTGASPSTEDEGGPGVAGHDALAPSEPVTLPNPTVVPPSPSPQATIEPTAEPTPQIEDGPYAMNLFRKGDFVEQYTFEWCVGASLQMMRNLTDAKVTRSRSTQRDYWELARDLSHSPFGGANPRGWTAALNELGYGPYTLVSVPKYSEALRVAATAMRETGRPVGLVMWRGRHAWVMSGFTANADPRAGDDFKVTGVRVLDPLYPHGNSVWGASPKPNTLLSPARLGKQFVFRERRRVNLGVPPGYLLILPTVDAAA
jgi:hypothetical protein